MDDTAAAEHALTTEPQYIDAPLTAAAAFLVVNINDGDDAMDQARSVVASIEDLLKDIKIQVNSGIFTANVGISHHAWEALTRKPLRRNSSLSRRSRAPGTRRSPPRAISFTTSAPIRSISSWNSRRSYWRHSGMP